MRNLVQYPVTHDEVLAVLVRAHHELVDPQLIGDLTGYILSKLTIAIKENPQLVPRIFDILNEPTAIAISRSTEEI